MTYRWQGVDKFTAELYRGRAQHDIYLHVYLQLFPKEKTARSREAIAALSEEQLANLNNDQIRHKQNIRGGLAVEFLEEDVGGRLLERLMVLNTGVQHYLNKCLQADKLVTEYTAMLQRVPAGATARPTAELMEARKSCIRVNHEIISGDAAIVALSDYSEFFAGSDSACWSGWRLDAEDRSKTCTHMICVMQDIAYRLIFKLDLDKYKIFDVAKIDDQVGDSFYDAQSVRAIAATSRQRAQTCGNCVDFSFTIP